MRFRRSRRFSRRRFRRHTFQWFPVLGNQNCFNATAAAGAAADSTHTWADAFSPNTLAFQWIAGGLAGASAGTQDNFDQPFGGLANFVAQVVRLKMLDSYNIVFVAPGNTGEANIQMVAVSTGLAVVPYQGTDFAYFTPAIEQWAPEDPMTRSRKGWFRIWEYFLDPVGAISAALQGITFAIPAGNQTPKAITGSCSGSARGGLPYHYRGRLYGRRCDTNREDLTFIHSFKQQQIISGQHELFSAIHWGRILLKSAR